MILQINVLYKQTLTYTYMLLWLGALFGIRGCSQTKYVDKILAFFRPPTPLRWHFQRIERWQKVDIIGPPTYLPRFVNIVCEQP
jgi:hypothetical protein